MTAPLAALPRPRSSVYRVVFNPCCHVALILGEEYGDGSAWCQRCGRFQIYDRCASCSAIDCESLRDDADGVCTA